MKKREGINLRLGLVLVAAAFLVLGTVATQAWAADGDGDGVNDSQDNCLEVPNPLQGDMDGDGLGNLCDSDTDGDGIANIADDDDDNDGFSDALEGSGITVDISGGSRTIPACTGPPVVGRDCVHPLSPDLFVILVRNSVIACPDAATCPSAEPADLPYACPTITCDDNCGPLFDNYDAAGNPGADGFNESNLPVPSQYATAYDPFELVYSAAPCGLAMGVHEISRDEVLPDPFDRRVTTASPQFALRVTETLHACGLELGVANEGTPMSLDLATIFTQRIINHVDSICAEATCQLESGAITLLQLKYLYIQWIIAHELGHMLTLGAVAYDSKLGGYHYSTRDQVVMSQFIKYKGKNTVTFYMGPCYADPDRIGVDFY